MAEEKKTPDGKIPMPVANFKVDANPGSRVKKMIGVVSGKGGVGKSSVTGLCALWSLRHGYRTGIMDCDITGPSIPRMFGVTSDDIGVEGVRPDGEGGTLIPAETSTGIKVMSMNLLMQNEEQPVVWRGPIVAGVVKQFWTDVKWGDVDYMFVDMPPGTGDVPLTVFQSLPVDGIIVVTSPQELVSMIVGKAVKMAEMMNIPVLGLVENMSYFKCPDCGKEYPVFGESRLEEVAAEYGVDVLGRLPIDPKLAAACDKGMIELFEGDWLDGAADKIEKL